MELRAALMYLLESIEVSMRTYIGYFHGKTFGALGYYNASAFENVLGRKHIGIKDDFFDLGGYSLAVFEAAALIGVSAQEIYENPTAEMLEAALIALKNKAISEENAINVNELIKHNSGILHNNDVKYVLLTGATGFLGSHILRELLRRKVHVICLVRNEEKLKEVNK